MRLQFLIAALAAVATAPVAATAQDAPTRVEVGMSNFAFTPETLTFTHGQPYVLVIRDDAGGGHNFEAARFFADAAVNPADRGLIKDGKVDLKGGASVEIHLTAPPTPGSYGVRCTHFMHAAMGMTGTIEVK